jgi:DNA topoisomerase-1
MKKLVIVESPTKVKSISKYLGSEYEVEASIGHIRDLPQPKDVPAQLKADFGQFAVDIHHGFKPYYVFSTGLRGSSKKKIVDQLKQKLAKCDQLILATDPDREGEAIAWHLREVLKPKVPVQRMVFNEVTKNSITRALTNTRDIDLNLVDAQEARRIVDRLFGYKTSPVLWRKVAPGLSAGRVQSPATRLIVERELERSVFVSKAYYSLTAHLPFPAQLTKVDQADVATSADFDSNGQTKPGVIILDQNRVEAIEQELPQLTFTVSKVKSTPYRRTPQAPFITSTLQQSAASVLGFSASQTMRAAQILYENGLITYMRTDSPTLSEEGMAGIREAIYEHFGDGLFQPRAYQAKSKNAQEAHEAIRPVGVAFVDPGQLQHKASDYVRIGPSEIELYSLIYWRTLASQMSDCVGETTSIKIQAGAYEFSAVGTVITQPGWRLAVKSSTKESVDLPECTVGDQLKLNSVTNESHKTNPPARYTEGSLVKKMEELGIGRPSTYASIIQTIIAHKYVTKKGQALVPSWLAFSVVKLLTNHLERLVDYNYTAEMELKLDEISLGRLAREKFLNEYYFGPQGIEQLVDHVEIDTQETNTIYVDRERRFRIRIGRKSVIVEDTQGTLDAEGRYPRAFVPYELTPDELNIERAEVLIAEAAEGNQVRKLGVYPENGEPVEILPGPYGPYLRVKIGETKPRGKDPVSKIKYKNAGLLKSMDPDTLTLDQALQLLALPRVLGVDPEDGIDIIVNNGPFGPYLMKQLPPKTDAETSSVDADVKAKTKGSTKTAAQTKTAKQTKTKVNAKSAVSAKAKKSAALVRDYRSLKDESLLFSITLEQAIELYRQPKNSRRTAKK